jgi:general secretion pathway protein D
MRAAGMNARRIVFCASWCLGAACLRALGDNLPVAAPPSTQPTVVASDDLIQLNFPENVDLKVFVAYVSERLGVNILYDDQTIAQRVTIQSPAPVPKSSLMGLLIATLRLKGLMLVDAEQPGWKRIVPVTSLAGAATPSTQPLSAIVSGSQAVTQVFLLKSADAQKVDEALHPFLTQPGGSSIPLPDQHLLIVSDFADVVARVAALVRLMDRPMAAPVVTFVPVQNVDASTLAPELMQILASANKSPAAGTNGATAAVDVLTEPRTNQLVLVGAEDKIADARKIIASLDTPLAMTTQVYQFHMASPEKVDRLARELIDPLLLKRLYQSAVDKDANVLIVTATPELQQKVAELKAQLDVATAAQGESPIRFYKLTNATATDVLQTIAAIEGQQPFSAAPAGNATESNPGAGVGGAPSTMNNPPSAPGQPPPTPPIYNGSSSSGGSSSGMSSPTDSEGGNTANGGTSQSTPAPTSIHTKDASITADPNTNTIIVVADPSTQSMYEKLIKTLDKRRPQVLIELTLVTLSDNQTFNFGVELSQGTKGNTRGYTFSSFGLSTVDPTTGQLTITPSVGFNGTVLSSDLASMVIQAVQTDGTDKVLSAPRILVNDNATGTLESVDESPYTSVNASTTVSTTSFAGYAEAGTTITVTPHISEGDHLQLEYSITLSDFTGSANSSSGIPPPRQTNTVSSKITVPDGNTVIVGGLKRTDSSHTKEGIPFLTDIPILGNLFSDITDSGDHSTLFVFIRPVILRDDEFADLKFYSERDGKAAGLPGDYPASEPLIVR